MAEGNVGTQRRRWLHLRTAERANGWLVPVTSGSGTILIQPCQKGPTTRTAPPA